MKNLVAGNFPLANYFIHHAALILAQLYVVIQISKQLYWIYLSLMWAVKPKKDAVIPFLDHKVITELSGSLRFFFKLEYSISNSYF